MIVGPRSTKLPQSWDTGSDQPSVPASFDVFLFHSIWQGAKPRTPTLRNTFPLTFPDRLPYLGIPGNDCLNVLMIFLFKHAVCVKPCLLRAKNVVGCSANKDRHWQVCKRTCEGCSWAQWSQLGVPHDSTSKCVYHCWWLGRPVNAHFLMRFSHRHSVFLCIFYHVYHVFVGWGGVGWGGMITFMLRVMHNALRCRCNVRARWHRYAVLRWWVGWGGVGWYRSCYAWCTTHCDVDVMFVHADICDVDVMFVHADIGTQCYVDGWGGVGWGGVGWDDNVHVTHDAQRTAMLM